MDLFGGAISITGIVFLVFMGFEIIFLGYLLGRIKIRGIGLGTAGVFIVALLFGALYSTEIGQTITQTVAGEPVDISLNALKVVNTTGLVLFVGSVGLISGPGFFKNIKSNFRDYLLVGLVVAVVGVLATTLCFYVGRGTEGNDQELVAALSGVMSGALTNSPALSSAKDVVATVAENPGAVLSAADAEAIVSVGYGISYVFGVVGIVFFMQIIPSITKANMEKERALISVADSSERAATKKRFKVDAQGICALAFVLVVGILVGSFRIPLTPAGYSGATLSLTSTGGVLLTGLVVGHFGHIGPVDVSLSPKRLGAFGSWDSSSSCLARVSLGA